MRKQRNDEVEGDMIYRAAMQLRPSSLSDAERSVDAVIATEAPIDEFDEQRGDIIPRVLLASGAEWPSQIPLLDSHNRKSLDGQIGSIRNIRREGGSIVGTLRFASDEQKTWNKVKEGHVTDVSVGAKVLREVYVPYGTNQVVNGYHARGPVNVTTRWRVKEASALPIGADEEAKLRGHDPHLIQKLRERIEMKLTPEQRQQLIVTRGLPEDASDEAIVNAILAKHEDILKPGVHGTEVKREAEPKVESPDIINLNEIRRNLPEEIAKSVKAVLDAERAEQAKLRKEIDDTLEIADMPDLKERAYGLPKMDDVRALILKERSERQKDPGFAPIRQKDQQPAGELRRAIGSALNLRAAESLGVSEAIREKFIPAKSIHADHERFAYAPMTDLARECLMADGYRYEELRGLTREQIAIAALGWPGKATLRSDPGYHNTASFPALTLDAANKSMRMGYAEEETTWQQLFRIGTDAQDFKNINRIGLGAVPNIPQWIDNTAPRQLQVNDERQYYAVECYSAEMSFSYKLLVNDDMDALTRVPAKMGAAMNRTINTVVWAEVTQAAGVGPTMPDGQALFSAVTGNRFRANYTTGSATPTVATVGAMRNQLRQMRGINVAGPGDTVAESDDILRIRPQFIVGPSALETTILQLVNSIADPAATGNQNVFNPARTLTPVIEPLLDAATNGTTAWYLLANPNMVDTVEVTFLAGQRSPVTRNWTDEKTLSQHWAILQTFAPKVLDYRGMARHKGA